MKKCPYCAEEIQDEAVLCRFCGRSLTAVATIPDAALSTESTVNLERKSSFYGMAVGWPVFLDDNKIESIGNGRTISIKVPAGRHKFYTKTLGMQSDILELNLVGGEIIELACGIQPGILTNKMFLRLESSRQAAAPSGAAFPAGPSGVSAAPSSFSVSKIEKPVPSWASPVSILSIVLGIVGLLILGIPLGIVAMSLGSIAVNAGDKKGTAGIVLGVIDIVAAFCAILMLSSQ